MAGLRDIPVKFLKGVGPQRSRLLAEELGIESYHDLLHHFPSGYIDRSRFYHIRELSEEMPSVQIRGRFISFAEQGEGAKRRLVGLFSDGTALLQAVWFHRISAIKKPITPESNIFSSVNHRCSTISGRSYIPKLT